MILTLATRTFVDREILGPTGEPIAAGREATMELPRYASETLGLRGLSLSAAMLSGWGLPDLDQLRDAADKAGCPCLVLVDDEPLAFGHARAKQRDDAADRVRRLGMAAHRLGCNALAIRVGADDDDAAFDRAATAVKAVMPGLERFEVNLLIAPCEGLTFQPDRLTELIKKIGGFRIGSLPSFEHAHATGDAVETLRKLAPYAGAVHASISKVGGKKGHGPWDLGECVAAIRSVGFQNTLAVDVVGSGDASAAVDAAREMLTTAIEADA